MSDNINIAVVGAASLEGKAALEILAEQDLPLGQVFVVDSDVSAGGRVEFDGKHQRIQPLAEFDFSQVQVALFFVASDLAEEYAPKAAGQGCVVIDDSACFRLDEDVPLVIADVNPEAIAGYKESGIIANPNGCVNILLTAIKPLHDAAGVTRVNVSTYQSASGAGQAGTEELASQATSMFNLREIKPKVFDKQLAFNLLPLIGALEDNGYSHEEMKMVREVAKLLGETAPTVNPTTVRVPVFHGHAMSVHLETRDKLTAAAAAKLLANAPGVSLIAADSEEGYPTPVTDAVGGDTVMVGRLREDISHDKGLDLWLVADNLRKGSALNSVQTCKILIKEYL